VQGSTTSNSVRLRTQSVTSATRRVIWHVVVLVEVPVLTIVIIMVREARAPFNLSKVFVSHSLP